VNTPPLLALLLLPFVAWLPGRARAFALTVWTACTAVIVPLSVGRAAWVGILAALLAYEVGSGFSVSRRARRAVGRAVAVRMLVLGVGLVAVFGVVFAATRSDISTSLDARLRLWHQAVGLFTADPITGAGPTTFSWARLVHVPAFADRVPARDAHSVPLQTLADGGLLLAIAFAGVVVAWGVLLVRRRAMLEPGRRLAAAVVIGYAAASLRDDLSFLPAIMVLVIVLAAWAVPPRRHTDPLRNRRRPPLMAAAFAVVLVLSVPWVLQLNLVRLETEAARQAALAGDWERALSGFQRAANGQPRSALHWMSVGYAAERLGRVDAAVSAYETARELSPGDARPWGALAALTDDPSEGARLLTNAAARTRDAQYAYRLTSGLESEIGRADAVRFMAISVVMRPDILATLGLDEASAVAGALPDAIAEAGQLAPRHPQESVWDAALLLGKTLPMDAPVQWRVVAAAREGDANRAKDLLGEAFRVDPTATRTQQAAAVVARLTCDRDALEQADRLLNLAARNQPIPRQGIAEDRTIGLYREPELGDYQPIDGPRVPEGPPWPFGLIEVPDCGW
jgi:tetratricopeptide (TPR) repeat protein